MYRENLRNLFFSVEKEAEYEGEYEDEKVDEEVEEALKYNEDATQDATSTLKPAVRKEIEKLKEAKCKGSHLIRSEKPFEFSFHFSDFSVFGKNQPFF